MMWPRVVFLGAVALVLSNASPAPAEIPVPQTDRQATLITPNQILVRVDFACQEGTDTGVGVGANQPNTVGASDTNGFGFTSLEATGQRQTAEVVVQSFQNPWRPGLASVNSAVSCGQGAFGRDSAEIVIELP